MQNHIFVWQKNLQFWRLPVNLLERCSLNGNKTVTSQTTFPPGIANIFMDTFEKKKPLTPASRNLPVGTEMWMIHLSFGRTNMKPWTNS